MKLRWFGHSAFEIISEEETRILIDPFISNNPTCNIPVEELKADLIFVTHGHADHLGDSMEIANRSKALLVGTHELSVFFSKQGLESEGMNIGGSLKFNDIKVTMVDAKHSPDIDFTDQITPGGSACGFIIQLEDGRKIYHAGDTGLFTDMKTVIGEIYKPDIALLPIGDRYTMGPEDAIIAAKWISPQKVIPMHYNTFPVIEQDPTILKEILEEETPIQVIILEPGETYEE
ncbi:MAG: metal-dependent hydrolase [Methanothermobacter sp.]|jgi:L-ascorbate metabolism protein UlaG (beta-lactamase superfamily)|nr:metal-dependent hydrolase [Methanothermobacter sp.]